MPQALPLQGRQTNLNEKKLNQPFATSLSTVVCRKVVFKGESITFWRKWVLRQESGILLATNVVPRLETDFENDDVLRTFL